MTKVYAWPPVGAKAHEWSVVDPVASSRSLLTGRRYVSAAQRRRRVAQLSVSSAYNEGAGYMEALKRLLKGGVHLVRLRSLPLTFTHIDPATRQAEEVSWFSADDPVDWRASGSGLTWLTGAIIAAAPTTYGATPALSLSGLPASAKVAVPGEFITVTDDATGLRETRMVLRPVTSDANGAAVAPVDEAFTLSGRANVGARDTAVFEPLDIPRAMRPVGADWLYDWSFREVFAEEVGGFEEVDPWR